MSKKKNRAKPFDWALARNKDVAKLEVPPPAVGDIWPEPWTVAGDGIWYWPPGQCRGTVHRRYATVADWQRGLGIEVGS